MNTILTIIGIACFAVLFAEASGIVDTLRFKYYMKKDGRFGINSPRWKPFDCPLCLAWWIGIIWFGITIHRPEAVLYAAICSILAIIISKTLRNL